jgi:hypothetical protein
MKMNNLLFYVAIVCNIMLFYMLMNYNTWHPKYSKGDIFITKQCDEYYLSGIIKDKKTYELIYKHRIDTFKVIINYHYYTEGHIDSLINDSTIIEYIPITNNKSNY